MEDVSPFVLHFSRLVWVLAHRPEDQEAQKEDLRRCLMMSSTEPQVLLLRDIALSLSVNQEVQDETTASVRELVMRMAGHSVRLFEFEAVARARDVLEVARALAMEPARGDEGAAIDEVLMNLNLTGVTSHLGSSGFVRHPTPGVLPAYSGSYRTPQYATAKAEESPLLPNPRTERQRHSGESQSIMQSQVMHVAGRDETVNDMLNRLDESADDANTVAIIDKVTRAAEDFGSQGKWVELVQVLDRMHKNYEKLHDGDAKRAFLMGVRRLQRPALMQGVARLLTTHREMREATIRVLGHAGEIGSDVLIDNLIGSEVTAERRAYLDALRQCPSAGNSLLQLLHDDRWYVVRNATWLLGELGFVEADRRLAELISHKEPRVRRAVATALGRLGTSRAVLALLQAINDPTPDVRLHAVQAIANAKNPRSVPWLIEALDHEQDADVQAALFSSLGAAPTEDGVARLVRAAEAGGLLVRKPAAMRVRAVEALAIAATPSARQALKRLLTDRDRDVRSAVENAVQKLDAGTRDAASAKKEGAA